MFLHQFLLHISECSNTTKFHKGPEPNHGKTNVQNAIKAPNVGTILNNLDTYSCHMLILFDFCNLPMNEYEVNVPDNIINGSVYRLAARPNTVHG